MSTLRSIVYGIGSVFIYLSICLFFYMVASNSYELSIRIGKPRRKLSVLLLLIMCFVFAYYNKINTVPGAIGGDRQNYMIDFYGRKTAYLGFDWYLQTMRKITNNDFFVTLYLTTFICCLVVLIAYKYSTLSTRLTLLFILSSNFVFFTFTGLKQATAGIFGNLFFLFALSERNDIYKEVLSIIMIVLSCLFHVTGYILIPIYFVLHLKFEDNKRAVRILILLIISVLFMQPILLGIGSMVSRLLPRVTLKINEYFIDRRDDMIDGRLASVKGMPYYCLVYYALKNRNKYKKIIPLYDKLFVLSVISAVLYFSTIISYWLSRFVNVFIFPLGILFGQIIENEESLVCRRNMYIVVLFMNTFLTLRSVLLVFINYGGY